MNMCAFFTNYDLGHLDNFFHERTIRLYSDRFSLTSCSCRRVTLPELFLRISMTLRETRSRDARVRANAEEGCMIKLDDDDKDEDDG